MRLPHFLTTAALTLTLLSAGWVSEAQAGPFRYRGHHDRWNHGYSAYSYAPAYSGYAVSPGYYWGYTPYVYPAGGYVTPGYGFGAAYFGGADFHHGGYYGHGYYGGWGGHGGYYGGGHHGYHH